MRIAYDWTWTVKDDDLEMTKFTIGNIANWKREMCVTSYFTFAFSTTLSASIRTMDATQPKI